MVMCTLVRIWMPAQVRSRLSQKPLPQRVNKLDDAGSMYSLNQDAACLRRVVTGQRFELSPERGSLQDIKKAADRWKVDELAPDRKVETLSVERHECKAERARGRGRGQAAIRRPP